MLTWKKSLGLVRRLRKVERSEGVVLTIDSGAKHIVVVKDNVLEGHIWLLIVDAERRKFIRMFLAKDEVRQLIEALAETAKLECRVSE